MRNRLPRSSAFAVLLLGAVAFGLVGGAASGEDEGDPAAKALEHSIAAGKALFHDASLGTNEKFCAKCHDDPDKPRLHLADRVNDYPKWDKHDKKVITLGQKIVQMIGRMLKGKAPELGSEKVVDIEAYLMSISRDRKR